MKALTSSKVVVTMHEIEQITEYTHFFIGNELTRRKHTCGSFPRTIIFTCCWLAKNKAIESWGWGWAGKLKHYTILLPISNHTFMRG